MLFNIQHFERQGCIDNDHHMDSLDDAREAVITLSAQASRSLKIFTPDLEADFYDNDALRRNLLDFVRGNRHASIQILAWNLDLGLHNGHRLLHLSRQLTSPMAIRKPAEEYRQTGMSFILQDQSCFIFRPDTTKVHTFQSFCKSRSQYLFEFFSGIWEHAETDPRCKIFYL